MMKNSTGFYCALYLILAVINFAQGQNIPHGFLRSNSTLHKKFVQHFGADASRTDFTKNRTKREPATWDIVCPDVGSILPCVCVYNTDYTVSVYCNGADVTQNTLVNLFIQLRSSNGLTPGQTLKFHRMEVGNSLITQLDLTPFMHLELTEGLHFYNDLHLTSIVGPPTATGGNARSIKVMVLEFRCSQDYGALTDQGFGDALKYFDVSMLGLFFDAHNMHGGQYPVGDGSGEIEFLLGLSAFTNLWGFLFQNSQSPSKSVIQGGQFKRNVNLQYLSFHRTGFTLGEDAFLFDESPPQWLNTPIGINLDSISIISNTDFKNAGNIINSRPIQIDFCLDYLGEETFKAFLLGHPENIIDVRGCSALHCDDRMKWLKDNPDLYKPHVIGGQCSNDPENKSIWETQLIP